MASAKLAMVGGMASSAARTSGGSEGNAAATLAGERRSGSAKTMSNAMAGAPAARTLSTSAASRVRGHGHCPTASRLRSSMSTMATGAGW